MDHHIGTLIEELAKLGVDDSTLVIVVGDHGESLGERGYVGHGRQLFESIVRVPLIVRYPERVPAGRVVAENVSILDIMPTVLDLAEIEYPLPLQGQTLGPLLDGAEGTNGSNGSNGANGAKGANANRPDTTYFLTFPGKKWQAPKWLSWLWYYDSKKRLPLKLGWIRGTQKVVWTPGSETVELLTLDGEGNGTQVLFSGQTNESHRADINELQAWFEATLMYRDDEFRLKQKDLEVLRSLGYVSD
jgi:hypothetical protein